MIPDDNLKFEFGDLIEYYGHVMIYIGPIIVHKIDQKTRIDTPYFVHQLTDAFPLGTRIIEISDYRVHAEVPDYTFGKRSKFCQTARVLSHVKDSRD